MNNAIRNFLVEEDGITALEYGLLACIVAAALIAVFSPAINSLYTSLMAQLTSAVGKLSS
jgi:pilus assembly protein Flp/PilA